MGSRHEGCCEGREVMNNSYERMKVSAVAFAIRAGHTDEMAHRFLNAVCQAGRLGQRHQYGVILSTLMREGEE
jgi:hypothetical protein